jgi:hypothetical protein
MPNPEFLTGFLSVSDGRAGEAKQARQENHTSRGVGDFPNFARPIPWAVAISSQAVSAA